MTTDFGLDLSSFEDVDESRTVTGLELIAQDAVWRLQTPRAMGILAADAPNYGLDLLDTIGSVETESDVASLPARIEAALREDERIDAVTVTVGRTIEGPAASFQIVIHCETSAGPFDLVGLAGDGNLALTIKLLPEGV